MTLMQFILNKVKMDAIYQSPTMPGKINIFQKYFTVVCKSRIYLKLCFLKKPNY